MTPEKLERWRTMTPAERERIRERYHRWKKLPQQQREKILERKRVWRELPEGQRRFLRQRREIYRDARPREKKAIEKFVNRWKQLPPERGAMECGATWPIGRISPQASGTGG